MLQQREPSWISLTRFLQFSSYSSLHLRCFIFVAMLALIQGWLLALRARMPRVQYLMLLAVGTGVLSGLIAVILKSLVHLIFSATQPFLQEVGWALFFPVLGLVLTVFLIRQFFGGVIERGVVMVLRAIGQKAGIIHFKHTYLHVITSSVTVGLGGSAGLEAPIVATGAAIGSNVSKLGEMPLQERNLLLACGSAAGIAAVFNAPVAGIMFAMEVLLAELSVSYFIPLVLAAVSGALVSKIILQESVLFSFVLKQGFDYRNLPYYVLLGLLAGLVSVYYATVFRATEQRLHQFKLHPYGKALVGGILLSALLLILPPLRGEGYGSVIHVATDALPAVTDKSWLLGGMNPDWAVLLVAGAVVLLKPLAVAITLGSGGNGGNFAPSLFTGAFLGYFFSRFLNLFAWINLPVGNFSLVAMAGVLSGVMYAPLTAVFLIAEITNGYELIIPLLVVSVLAYFVVKSHHPVSMDLRRLAAQGKLPAADKEKQILAGIQLEDLLQEQYQSIAADQKLRALVQLVQQSEKHIYAVHDAHQRLVGMIELNDIKLLLFQQEQYDRRSVKSLMKKPPALLRLSMPMREVMDWFDRTQSWYLPVVDEQQRFVGFISKTKLFNKYRENLQASSDIYEQPDSTESSPPKSE